MTIPRALPLREAWRGLFSLDDYERIPPWQRLAVTLLFSAALAVPFTVLGFVLYANGDGAWRNLPGWVEWYGRNLVVSLSVGLAIYALYATLFAAVGGPRLQAMRRTPRGWLMGSVPLVGVLVGWPVGLALAGMDVVRFLGLRNADDAARTLLLMLLIAFVFSLVFGARARQLEAEKRAGEAQLRLLQGQIEPHFLFNTMANVQALIDIDAERAKAMLESFSDYLRASLGALRAERTRLGDEIALVRAYLGVLQARMGERLRYEIDVDPALLDAAVPVLCLQPLVENAVHHGLEPKIEGGRVTVRAQRDGAALMLEVRDDGLGRGAARGRRKGHGMALQNLRERLAGRYGGAARLMLADASPGTVAALRLPLEAAP